MYQTGYLDETFWIFGDNAHKNAFKTKDVITSTPHIFDETDHKRPYYIVVYPYFPFNNTNYPQNTLGTQIAKPPSDFRQIYV